MADYKLLKEYYADGSEELMPSVIRKSDNAQIPYDTTNRDYVEYLEWKDAGNNPDDADPRPS